MVAVFLVPNSNELHGEINYRTTTDAALLLNATRDVCRGFIDLCDAVGNLRWAFVATWDGVADWYNQESSSPGNTFQLVLVTDGRKSFALFNYQTITWTQNALVGFVGEICC